jgi:hypothetical protein
MRVFGAVVLLAWMVWIMVGCGSAVKAAGGAVVSALTLQDSVTQARYNLTVANGAPTLTSMSGNATAAVAGTVGSEPELVDGTTGTLYQLGVANGALNLTAEESAGLGVAKIGLADSVTAETYELAVVSGALTLSAGDGQ